MEIDRRRRNAAALFALACCAASLDDGRASFDRGVALDNGGAARQDAAAAFVWYKRAAQAGSAQGAFNVAVMFDAGRGAPHDPAQAAAWYAVAAAGAEPRAAYNLGGLYAAGEGVPRNPGLAAAWFARASELGVAQARAWLRSRRRLLQPVAATGPPPAARPLAPMLASARDGVSLVWTAPAWPDEERFFVQVAAARAGASQDVFTATTAVSALRVALAPGAYAWRVLTLDASAAHYTPSPWVRFSVPPA